MNLNVAKQKPERDTVNLLFSHPYEKERSELNEIKLGLERDNNRHKPT